MKLYLAILLVSFIFIGAHGSRIKRGLNADEQKKFLEKLNEDRKKVALAERLKYLPMRYDASLEKEVANAKKCVNLDKHWLPLRYNDAAEELRKYHMDASTGEGDIYRWYFDPSHDRIGCSKETRCTEVLNERYVRTKLEGKTIEYYGMCALGKSGTYATTEGLRKGKVPSPNKYADSLGIPEIEIPEGKQESGVESSGMDGAAGEQGSGSGSAFSLIISLSLVLYI